MNWYAAITCFIGGSLAIAGLMGWHIAAADAFGFVSALASAFAMWLAGNALNAAYAKSYAVLVIFAAVAVVLSLVAVGA